MVFYNKVTERKYIDWNEYYDKKFKLVYTPKGKQTGKWEKGQISIVTPKNKRAWEEWPEVSREDYLRFKNNWRNIQKNLSDDKYLQITETNGMQFDKLVNRLLEKVLILM